jgi:carbon storage regulator CsrA
MGKLIVTRRQDEMVVIRAKDVEIKVMVTGVCGESVKLGFVAPPEVEIWREELVIVPDHKESREPGSSDVVM